MNDEGETGCGGPARASRSESVSAEAFRIDFDRERRLGFPEVVYGSGKPVELLLSILESVSGAGRPVLLTRVQEDKAAVLLKEHSQARYDPVSGCLLVGAVPEPRHQGRVAILSAGSSDMAVVNEASLTLEFLGESSATICDVGVAGLHRLLDRLDEIRTYKVLIVVAGFEGALPSVVGGLLPQPLIAVPTSTGYGIGGDGSTALHAMLSSCANGITVVNIDNGYGAAIAAARILGR